MPVSRSFNAFSSCPISASNLPLNRTPKLPIHTAAQIYSALFHYVHAIFDPVVEAITNLPGYLWYSDAECIGSTGNLQIYYDFLFPSSAGVDYSLDPYLVEIAEFDMEMDHCVVDGLRGHFSFPRYDHVRPVLRTQMPPRKPNTQIECILGFQKRNANVPRMHCGLTPELLADHTYENFIKSVVGDMTVFLQYSDLEIELSEEDFDEWASTQSDERIVRILSYSDLPLSERLTHVFDFMIKSAVKPALSDSSAMTIQSVQTIAAAAKSVNAIFCPIFRRLKNRWLKVLSDKYVYFTDLSVGEFEDCLNSRFDVPTYVASCRVENDISKYDKSMRHWTLLFEMKVYRALGLPEYLADIWYNSHVLSRYVDRHNGFSSKVEFQRRSGDASTFFGNTLVNHAACMAVYPSDDIVGGVFAGDDNHIWGGPSLLFDSSPIYADFFNFESKTLSDFEYSYFCGKFILPVHGSFCVVPDPVKCLMKWGRRDLVNWDHVREYYVSCVDVMRPLRNTFAHNHLSAAIAERYRSEYTDFSGLFRSMNWALSSHDAFQSLFYTLPSDDLCLDPTRPSLEV